MEELPLSCLILWWIKSFRDVELLIKLWESLINGLMKIHMRVVLLLLVAKIPADKLYLKHHFCYLPENRVGMIRDKD